MSHSCEQGHVLFDFATGKLPAERTRQIEEHVAGCPSCRGELEAVRRLAGDLGRVRQATQHDLPAATASALLEEAGAMLRERTGSTLRRLETIRRRARRKRRLTLLRRMILPAAAAILILFGIEVLAPLFVTQQPQYPAVLDLYVGARQVVTIEGVNRLEPIARQALDETVAAPSPDVIRVANLQLVHYITLRAVDPEQIKDVRFLLAMVQADEREGDVPVAEAPDRGWFDGLTRTAHAATAADWIDTTRGLLSAGRYEEAYRFLTGSETIAAQPLTAYAAIRARRFEDARELFEVLIELERGDPRLIELLRAELAMAEGQFDLAMQHFASAAESDSRLWLQAGYLCKYELRDDVLAGQLFERAGDERIAAHVSKRFRPDVRLARRAAEMMGEDFETYPVGSLPSSWRLIPTHAGEFEIARVDGSNVLKQNELGYRGAKLATGYMGWHNYTLGCDFKVLRHTAEPRIDILIYDQVLSYYALRLQEDRAQLIRKTHSRAESEIDVPPGARATLPEPVKAGNWWRSRIQVLNLDTNRTQVAVKLWLRDRDEPGEPHILWTDAAADDGQTLRRGRVGFRVEGAEVAFDEVTVTANEESP